MGGCHLEQGVARLVEILTESIQPGGNVTAMSRAPNKLDAFHVGNDGGVYTAAWESGVNK